MSVSVFDLFKIGIGPSSSHTVGPMRAAARFVERWLVDTGDLARTARVRAEVFGSLALTGRGHGTDKAVLMGLEGHWPNRIDPDIIPPALERIRKSKRIHLFGRHEIDFDEKRDLVMNKRQKLPFHTNGMRFTAYDAADNVIATRDYYSVGGGFVVNQDEAAEDRIVADETPLAHPFHSGAELLERCAETKLSIAALMYENEHAWRARDEIDAGLDDIWAAMQACVARGIRESGTLPGGLHVARRAPALYAELSSRPEAAMRDPLTTLDWVNLYALAVNEENAAGGRVVTAPTNGAAGIIPAVLHYYDRFIPGSTLQGVRDFLMTAAAVGILYKENASISGAEVGCQGEVGVACSMAAADSPPRSAAASARSRTPPKSAWNTTSASPATRSAASCRSRASNATRWVRSRRSTPRAWRCAATASTRSASTRSSRPCATPAATCRTSTRKPRAAASRSTSSSAERSPVLNHR
jgi:L-serine dehydratase